MSDKYILLSSNKAQSFNENLASKILHLSAASEGFFNGMSWHINIRAWVGVEMVEVLGALMEHELGVDLAGLEPWEGVRGREVWCGDLLMEALYGGQSLRPEVPLRRVEEQEVKGSDVCEEEPGCVGWSLHL